MSNLQYPVGPFQPAPTTTPEDRIAHIETLAALPNRLTLAVEGLTDAQLDTPYRDGGWTVRQVVHHIADSHLNAYVRMKLAATETDPTIRLYDEKAWAQQDDARTAPVVLSLQLIEALHARWVWWLRALTAPDFESTVRHPESGDMSLDVLVQLYAWHSRHHLAHISGLVSRSGW